MVETATLVATGTSTTIKTAIAVMAAAAKAITTTMVEAVVALLARPPPHWFRWQDQRIVADLWPLVAGAHDYVPRPCARWIAMSTGLCGHTGPLRISRPPVGATVAAAAAAVPAGHPGPRMEPVARRRLGPAIAGQLLQHHGAPPTPTSILYLNNILLSPDMVQSLLFVVLPLTIGALWNLTRLVCP
jgi:hypothetical protein